MRRTSALVVFALALLAIADARAGERADAPTRARAPSVAAAGAQLETKNGCEALSLAEDVNTARRACIEIGAATFLTWARASIADACHVRAVLDGASERIASLEDAAAALTAADVLSRKDAAHVTWHLENRQLRDAGKARADVEGDKHVLQIVRAA